VLRIIIVLSTLGAVTSLAQPSVEEAAKSPVRPAASNAVSVRLSTGYPSVAPMPGLGGLGGFVLPEAGFSYEHAFGHLSFVLSVDGSASASSTSLWLSGSLEPGLRWNFRDTALSGPWIGAHVPISLSSARTRFTSSAGTSASEVGTFGIGADAMAGWSFRLGESLIAQAAVGPRVRVARADANFEGTLASDTSLSVGVRGFVSVGAAF